MKLVEYKTRKIKEEYVNKKGITKTRKIKEEYVETNNYFYQKDHLGSIIAITDETGTIVEEYSYDIFWKPYTKKSDGIITKLKKSPIGNTRMYTGREYDRGLKLYYNRARYYDPKLARFISRDPIDIADDVNLYAYVGNSSVMFVDLMGTDKNNFKDKLINSIEDKIDYTQLMIIETWVYGLTHGANIYSEIVDKINDWSEYFWKPLNLQDWDVTSYMLTHAVFWYGSDMYISNEHFIWREFQQTDFYKTAIKDAINESENWIINTYVTTKTVTDSWDFSNWFWTINYSVTWKINSDWSIETNFQIVDLYKFYDLWDDTLVHNNIAWISQVNNLSVTPYTYTVDIYNITK